MMPQPQSDYFAKALAYRLIHETERAQRAILQFIQDGRYQLAAECSEAWKEDVMRACHEMNAASADTSADTIRRLQEEVVRLLCLMPMLSYPPGPVTVQPPEPAPSIEELYRELKPDTEPPTDSIGEPVSNVPRAEEDITL